MQRRLSNEMQAAQDMGYTIPAHDRFDTYDRPAPLDKPISMGQGHTVAELMALTLPPIQQICGPLMSAGVTMLAGAAGVGKSLFALHMAAHIAAGEDFEGWKIPGALNVMYVDGEMASQYLQGRAVNLPNTTDKLRIIHLNYIQGSDYIDLAQQRWRDWFVRPEVLATTDVFVFDTVSSLVMPSEDVSVYSPEFWLQLEPWHNQFRALGKTVVWIDNLNKNGEIFGTAVKSHKVDSSWLFEQPKQVDIHTDATAGFNLTKGKIRGEPHQIDSQWQYLKNYGWRMS